MDPSLKGNDVLTSDATATRPAWAIPFSPLLWGTSIRILVVMDGRIRAGSNPNEFGLGLVLSTLRDQSPWWVRFAVTVAHRDTPYSTPAYSGLDPTTPTEFQAGLDFIGFRFTQSGFKINEYDQIWFFGDWPGEFANDPEVNDAEIADPRNLPLSDQELKLIADWMDRGGGVFATGDHSLLGASLCDHLPRVRTMRRWTRAQQVPSYDGSDRHQTLVSAPGGQDAEEGDRWPQRIFPVLTPVFRGPFVYPSSPHPILCGRSAVIQDFPDHMHEGGLFEDDEVALDTPLDIPDYDRVEYPTVPPAVEAAVAGGGAAGGVVALGFRPRPHVIAHGLTTNTESVPRIFAMVGTYDGDPLGIGRVVVDSTWHHWFSYNLVGLRDYSPGVYAGMQDYYCNIALWLSTPEQRASMLFAATWGVLVGSQPGAFDVALGIRGIGERVVDVIGRTASQCIVDELVAAVAELPASGITPSVADRSWLWAPSGSSLRTAIVGGIASRMIKQAHQHINEETHGQKSRFDADAVRRLGLEGVAAGKQELVAALSQGSESFGVMRDLLAKQGDRTSLGEIPIGAAE